MVWLRGGLLVLMLSLMGCELSSPDLLKAEEANLQQAHAELMHIQEDIKSLPMLQQQVRDLEDEKQKLLKRRKALLLQRRK